MPARRSEARGLSESFSASGRRRAPRSKRSGTFTNAGRVAAGILEALRRKLQSHDFPEKDFIKPTTGVTARIWRILSRW